MEQYQKYHIIGWNSPTGEITPDLTVKVADIDTVGGMPGIEFLRRAHHNAKNPNKAASDFGAVRLKTPGGVQDLTLVELQNRADRLSKSGDVKSAKALKECVERLSAKVVGPQKVKTQEEKIQVPLSRTQNKPVNRGAGAAHP